MRKLQRAAALWAGMWFGGMFLCVVNTLHVFSASIRYAIFGCTVSGLFAFMAALIDSRGRK